MGIQEPSKSSSHPRNHSVVNAVLEVGIGCSWSTGNRQVDGRKKGWPAGSQLLESNI